MLYYPKKQPKNATLLSVILYMSAAAMFLISELAAPRLLWQLFALILVSVGIFFTARYLLTDYKYVIKDSEQSEGESKFTIIKVNGKREAIMATFNLADAYSLERCKKLRFFEKKHGKVDKFYGYCSNFSSPDTHILAINFNNMKIALAIELSPEFAYELGSRIPRQTDENK